MEKQKPTIEEYMRGVVTGEDLSEAEKEKASAKIREAKLEWKENLQLQPVEKDPLPKERKESAKDFDERLRAELKDTIFPYLNKDSGKELLEAFTKVCTDGVRNYWKVDSDQTERTLKNLINVASTPKVIRDLLENVVKTLSEEEAQDYRRNQLENQKAA
jgi:flagellar motility protein MotE (MotC chaperone)